MNDDDEYLIEWSEIWGFAVAIFLMARGEVERPPVGTNYHRWAKKHVSRQKWRATMREVKAMTSEQRADVIRPFAGDYDA